MPFTTHNQPVMKPGVPSTIITLVLILRVAGKMALHSVKIAAWGQHMMLKVKGDHYKRFVAGGREYQIVWDTNSVAAPDGCLVIAVDFSRPVGQREIYRKSGLEHE